MGLQTWFNQWRQRSLYESPSLAATMANLSPHDRAQVLLGAARQYALSHPETVAQRPAEERRPLTPRSTTVAAEQTLSARERAERIWQRVSALERQGRSQDGLSH